VEEVLFEPAVPLEGKAEVYLQKILTGMRSTLKNRLRESTERYPGQERTRWLMDKGSDDAPTDPAQISLLTSMIYYARAVETAFRYVLATSTFCDIDIDILRHRHLATSCDILRHRHLGGTRCVTSSTGNTMKRPARITLRVERIRTCLIFYLSFEVELQGLTFFRFAVAWAVVILRRYGISMRRKKHSWGN
jgi:hypothetical protein